MHPNMNRIRRELQKGQKLTFHDIEARCFISARNGREYLSLLHSMKEIHITGWRRDSPQGRWTPEYLWGANDNEPQKPHLITKAEYRLNEGVKEREAARKRSQRKMNKVVQIPSVVSFLLGA